MESKGSSDRSHGASASVLVVASPPRAAYLCELMDANRNDVAHYAIAVTDNVAMLDDLVRPRVDVDPWDVVLLDGASIVDGEGRPFFDPLVTLAANAPAHTILLYVAPSAMPIDHAWRAFQWVHDIVCDDRLLDLALPRRVESAALARARWNRYVRWRRTVAPGSYLRRIRVVH